MHQRLAGRRQRSGGVYYPAASRATGATGVSWAHGVGRIGAITGSLSGGVMLGLGMGFDSIFTLLMLPALLAAAAIFFMSMRYRTLAAQPASVAP